MRPDAPRLLLAMTFAASLAVNSLPLFRPILLGDDLEIVVRSWTWERTRATLWEPQNEHAMPLGRLSTRGVVLLAGRPSRLPLLTALQGPLAQLTAMGLLYVFVRRELSDANLAAIATAIFGVTSLYHQAIFWFAASFSLLALDTLLLALLAAQGWLQTRRWWWLAASALGTMLAPAWFASGVLAGPLCALYLLLGSVNEVERANANTKLRLRRLQFLVPLVGTAVFVVSLPRSTVEHVMHLEHYEGRPATDAFHVGTGAWYTARSLVDNLCLGQFGVSGVRCPSWLVPLPLLIIGAAAIAWWRRAPHRPLLALGLAFIFSSYLLVYSARAEWDYDVADFSTPTWGRYHLLPQLGLALFVVGGMRPGVTLDRRRLRLAAWLLVGACIVHFPRVVVQHCYPDPSARPFGIRLIDPAEQQAVLVRVEELDARCKEFSIDAETARAALARQQLPLGSDKENVWDLLRGSDAPRPISVGEARRLLDSARD
jgi:hypothetical protein